MSKKNDQIRDYLVKYYAMETPPRFAVMLTGKWGSGKTWFVLDSIERYRVRGGKAVYVSLYGVSTTRGIEDELFRQLHPILGGKKMKLLGTVMKGVVKGTLKIDFDGDGKEDGAWNAQVPDINLPEYLRSAGENVLVFDDLERCSIPIQDLLGYVNSFVEHGGHKVVLVANEIEILAVADDKERSRAYRRVKEKLIGKAFEIESDVHEALDSFFLELPDGPTRDAIASRKDLITQIYRASNYENLRNLRQALLEFERLLSGLEDGYRKCGPLISDLLTEFMLLTFEVRSGNISPEEIRGLTERLNLAVHRSAKELTEIESKSIDMSARYASFDWRNDTLPSALWSDIMVTGLIDKDKVNNALRESRHFSPELIPAWRKLWEFSSLSDAEFERCKSEVWSDLQNDNFCELGVLRHVIGILLALRSVNLFSFSESVILAEGKRSVEALRVAKRLDCSHFTAHFGPFDSTGWLGLGFHMKDSKEMISFTKFLRSNALQATKDAYPEEAARLLELLKSDPFKFASSIVVTRDGDNHYYQIPILAEMSVDGFCEAARDIPPNAFRSLYSAMRVRYSVPGTSAYEQLQPETKWMLRVARKLRAESKTMKGSVTGNRLTDLAQLLDEQAKGYKTLTPSPSGKSRTELDNTP